MNETHPGMTDIPPIELEPMYLMDKAIFTLRLQNLMDHLIPQVSDYLHASTDSITLEIQHNEETGDIHFILTPKQGTH